MPIPTSNELRAAYANALKLNDGAIGSAAGLRAAVTVILPDEVELPAEASFMAIVRQSERRRIQEKFLALADALAPLALLRQAISDVPAQQERADG